MSRTTRRNRPDIAYYYRHANLIPAERCLSGFVSWWGRKRREFSRDRLRDGVATEVPSGKRFKATYRRIEKRRRNHALRTGDVLTASAPEKECLWKEAWY